ncbi:MAG: hypothetical protein LBT57_01900 [Puniceicoccales bacterium]|nr:hypothetical protein [Puniceicoccales bacterium]
MQLHLRAPQSPLQEVVLLKQEVVLALAFQLQQIQLQLQQIQLQQIQLQQLQLQQLQLQQIQ